jgi:hypothetical protein
VRAEIKYPNKSAKAILQLLRKGDPKSSRKTIVHITRNPRPRYSEEPYKRRNPCKIRNEACFKIVSAVLYSTYIEKIRLTDIAYGIRAASPTPLLNANSNQGNSNEEYPEACKPRWKDFAKNRAWDKRETRLKDGTNHKDA